MKKIVLIFIIFLLTGCYDYIEVNDLAFVSTIAIDYTNDNYLISLEIVNDTKQTEYESNNKTYIIKETGETIAKAFDNLSLKIPKHPYYEHLNAIIISEDIAKNHMHELIDYILRTPKISNEVYTVISYNSLASNILDYSTSYSPIVGIQIKKLIEVNENNYHISFNQTLENLIKDFINKKKDATTTSIEIIDDKIKIKGIAIFDNYKYKITLNEYESSLLNILNNQNSNVLLTKYYDNKIVSIKVYNSKTKYQIDSNNITINIETSGGIIENEPSFDLKKEDSFKKLNNDFNIILKDDISNLIDILKQNKIDPLGINDMYYKKTKNINHNLFNNSNININTKLTINKKGLIYKVNK